MQDLTAEGYDLIMTMDDETLISIFVSNQRRIEELFISSGQIPSSKPTHVQALFQPESTQCDVVKKQGLHHFFDKTENKCSVIINDFETIKKFSEISQKNPVIVDHTINLAEDGSKGNEFSQSVDSLYSKNSDEFANCSEIPGIGCNSDDHIKSSDYKGEILNDDIDTPRNVLDGNEPKDIIETIENDANINLFKMNLKYKKHRKKAQSSSMLDDIHDQLQPSPKRKRYNSSSSIFCISERCSESVSAKSLLTSNTISVDSNIGNKKSDIVEENSMSTEHIISLHKVKQKKTKILNSPFKKKQSCGVYSGQNPKKCFLPMSSKSCNTLNSNSLEPYVACWAHCPAMSSRNPQAHCVPKSQFMEHLKVCHGMAKPINLLNQQIVSICSNCETVVKYDHGSKTEHIVERCSNKWHQQFYLFMENTQDTFAVKWFNAPVVKSPGLAHIVKSVAFHPHLDTLTWKNVKNEYFCYHFCCFCNTFVEDERNLVSSHTSAILHRINFRKSGYKQH